MSHLRRSTSRMNLSKIDKILKPKRSQRKDLARQQHHWLHRFFAQLRSGTFADGAVEPKDREYHQGLCGLFPKLFFELPPKTRNKLQTYLRLERVDANKHMTDAEFLECMYNEMMQIMALYNYPEYNMLRMVDTSKK